MKTIFKYVLLYLIIITFTNMSFAKEIKSNVITLFDFSNSYFMPERNKVVKKNLSKLATAMTSRKDGPQQPILFLHFFPRF